MRLFSVSKAVVAEWFKAVDLSAKLYWGDPREFEPRRQQHEVLLLVRVCVGRRQSFLQLSMYPFTAPAGVARNVPFMKVVDDHPERPCLSKDTFDLLSRQSLVVPF